MLIYPESDMQKKNIFKKILINANVIAIKPGVASIRGN